jgi:fatty-acyl-CoA synthase
VSTLTPYVELAGRGRRLANGLQRLGVGRGDRVAWRGWDPTTLGSWSCADFRSGDVTVAIAPFFRVGGTGVNVLPVLFMGGTVVVPSDLRPGAILQAMQRHRVTVGFGNPDLLAAVASSETWPQVDLSSLRFVVTGGAPVPERLIRAWLDWGVLLVRGPTSWRGTGGDRRPPARSCQRTAGGTRSGTAASPASRAHLPPAPA